MSSLENVSSSPLVFTPPSISEEYWKVREEKQKQMMMEMIEKEREDRKKERRELEEMIQHEREDRRKEKEKMESEKLQEKEERMEILKEIRDLKTTVKNCLEALTLRLPQKCSVREVSSSPPPPRSSSRSQSKSHPFDSLSSESLTFNSEYHCGAVLLSNNLMTVKNVSNTHAARLVVVGNKKFTRGIVTVRIKINEMSCPSGCVLGVLPELPSNFQNAFGYHNFVDGYGLHADRNKKGIYQNGELRKNSTCGFHKGDTVEMIFDVYHGHLKYTVNGLKCSKVINNAVVRAGGYVAGTLRDDATWTIVLAEYRNRN